MCLDSGISQAGIREGKLGDQCTVKTVEEVARRLRLSSSVAER